jgi:hypothetical protein
MTAPRLLAFIGAALLIAASAARAADTSGTATPHEPYSCRLFADEQRKCAFGSCDQRTIERLKRECLRDGGYL